MYFILIIVNTGSVLLFFFSFIVSLDDADENVTIIITTALWLLAAYRVLCSSRLAACHFCCVSVKLEPMWLFHLDHQRSVELHGE